MPWLIGIDEAGYGPNLGPMVQVSAPICVPDRDKCLWKTLTAIVRRAGDPADGRLLIDDSKKVYEGAHGFLRLEHGALAALAASLTLPVSLGDLLRQHALDECRTDLLREPWFDVTSTFPTVATLEAVLSDGQSFQRGCSKSKLNLGAIRTVVTPAWRFNALIDRWGNKAGAVGAGVIALLQANRQLPGDEPLVFLIDKLGGRHFYAAMIQEAFPDGWVSAEREGPEICSYKILGIDRDIRLVFQPRADGTHLTVALASMLAKYLREVFMKQFNGYWQSHVPGIKPTAGYPGDAARFMRQIRVKVKALGFEEEAIWRKR